MYVENVSCSQHIYYWSNLTWKNSNVVQKNFGVKSMGNWHSENILAFSNMCQLNFIAALGGKPYQSHFTDEKKKEV